MTIDINQALQEFISANSRITQSYFAFTNKILEIVSKEPNQQKILLQLLEQTENITQTFLTAHQQLLPGAVPRQVTASELPRNEREPVSVFNAPLEKEVKEEPTSSLASAPETESSQLDIEQTIKGVIAHLTGFSLSDIDLTLSFDDLGLDSLGRLDMLEELLAENPKLGDYAQNLTNMDTPREMVDFLEEKLSPPATTDMSLETVLFQHLDKFDDEITRDTPFSHYMTDGFVQASLWEKLSSQHDLYHFAGEALMSRHNAGETLALLNRLG